MMPAGPDRPTRRIEIPKHLLPPDPDPLDLQPNATGVYEQLAAAKKAEQDMLRVVAYLVQQLGGRVSMPASALCENPWQLLITREQDDVIMESKPW
jgi:hypothetical protein